SASTHSPRGPPTPRPRGASPRRTWWPTWSSTSRSGAWGPSPTWWGPACSCSPTTRRGYPATSSTSTADRSSAHDTRARNGQVAMMRHVARLAYIGLGNMGSPMAQRWLDWPGGLTVCDARAEATAPFGEKGATVAATPAAAAAGADVVSVTVIDDAQVREVVEGADGILSTAREGTVVAVHSTIADTTAVALAARCAERGIELVDAPVSGGGAGAHRGDLAVMVGGPDSAFAAVREPFERFAGLVVHAGPVGAGTRMKLARN